MKALFLVFVPILMSNVSCSDGDTDDANSSQETTGGNVSFGGNAGIGGLANGGNPPSNSTGGRPPVQTDCSPFSACGGDPIGSWRFTGMCFLPEPWPGCPGMVVNGTGSADGTYEVSATETTARLTESAGFTVEVPTSCLEGTPCDEVFAGFGSAVGAQVVATETPDGCVIAITQPPLEMSITRSIEIDGAMMIDEVGRETEFCQVGDQLRLRARDDNPFGVAYALER